MKFKELDTVVLDRDVPELGLRRGDHGAVVQVYPPDGLEVEFVTAAGRTQALAELRQVDLRAVGACLRHGSRSHPKSRSR
jgi:hypothetical protein